MKEFDYKLAKKLEGGIDNPYKGEVKINILPYVERNALLKAMNFKIGSDGAADFQDNLEASLKLSSAVKENVKSLKVYKGKKLFTDFDELDYDQDVGLLYNELGLVLMRGVNLGNG